MRTTELLQSQTSADTQDNERSTFENVNKFQTVENTPFALIERDGKWGIVMGNQMVSDQYFDTTEEAERFIESKPWSLILVAALTFVDGAYQFKNELANENVEQTTEN